MMSALLGGLHRLWMTSARLCGSCVAGGDYPRLCTQPWCPGESASRSLTTISTVDTVTGGLVVPKVLCVLGLGQRFSASTAAVSGW
jgi:hypothetical protein